MFAKGSRYERVPQGVWHDAAGESHPFVLLRVIPRPAGFQTHRVADGDRLDLLANRYFGDPEQFWRICDGNAALWPDDLLAELGRTLAIPVAER
jgi:hypothetical protein